LNHTSVLIVSDDPEFARTVAARWQSELHVPGITIVTSDLWRAASCTGYDLSIIGPTREGKRAPILTAASARSGSAAVCVADEKDIPALHAEYPQVLLVPMQDGWASALILVCVETLRRVDAVARAQDSERQALASERHATLGRYMLEMRPNVNNALTSVLGNADLLLLESDRVPDEFRDQIRAIHTMALRLNEIMQRFSSLAAEMRLGENHSQAETKPAFSHLVSRP
jgi:signal transduction histidine kinase